MPRAVVRRLKQRQRGARAHLNGRDRREPHEGSPAELRPGAGGFIDIAHNARQLVFTGTFTTGGLQIGFDDGKLRIVKEGKIRKFVPKVEQITYPVRRNIRERGQKAMLITERAVFDVTGDDLVLIEVAPGIDVRTQVLESMAAGKVRVADDLTTMDASLFAQ